MTFENKNSNKVVPVGIRKENGFADPNEAYPKKSF